MTDREAVRMFVNGQAMSGGSLHEPLARAGRLLGRVRTSPDYRFWSCRDEFPGLSPVSEGGWSVPGELYEVEYAVLRRDLLPREPAELELGIVQLDDGRGTLSMRFREEVMTRADELLLPIPARMGWLEYLETQARAR